MKTWFQQNRFLGIFLAVFALATIACLFFLFSARSSFHDAKLAFESNAAELNRLQRLAPFPTEANLRKMRSQAEDYASELNKLQEQLKTRVLPVVAMAPNEFQSRLRQASNALAEKARANRVKLPDNFYLGFEEFAAALPDTDAAPLLGQQLAQAELLANILIDARVEAISSFRRVSAAEQTTVATPTPAPTPRRGAAAAPAGPKMIERVAIETSFVSPPGAARRVLNQIATNEQQFYIVRTLHVLNEKDKGPPRDGAPGAAAPAATPAAPGATQASALQFIVGTERVTTSARVEMLRFRF